MTALAPATAPDDSAPVLSRRGHFWIGAERDAHAGVPVAPMYVYWEAPAEIVHPYPIVLVHGGGGQGLDYMTTPDGRKGWSTLLVEQGWLVYVVDRPGHGRSPYIPELMGEAGPPLPPDLLAAIFTPPAEGPAALPFAHLHTQWPGDRTDPNDPALLQFLASGGPFPGDAERRQSVERDRLAELLDRTGPAFLLSNSLGGPPGFLAADARPELVKALVQLEPVGPAFATNFGPTTLQWGLSAVPVAYEPAVESPSELSLVDAGGYTMQADPPRRLANLSRMPIAVVTAEASVFTFSDGPLVEFLRQAGCNAVHLQLADEDVRGNSHGAMFERNNADVLAVVTRWLLAQIG